MAKIYILKTNITDLDVDAIVNPANTSLLAGSGLCGVIHKAAGKELETECKQIGGCPTGQAVITRGYDLNAAYVIHAVGPHYYRDGENAHQLLENCYLNIMKTANINMLKSIAIPAISTGVYRYPHRDAANITLKKICDFITHENEHVMDIVFAVPTEDNFQIYNELYAQYFTS